MYVNIVLGLQMKLTTAVRKQQEHHLYIYFVINTTNFTHQLILPILFSSMKTNCPQIAKTPEKEALRLDSVLIEILFTLHRSISEKNPQ